MVDACFAIDVRGSARAYCKKYCKLIQNIRHSATDLVVQARPNAKNIIKRYIKLEIRVDLCDVT